MFDFDLAYMVTFVNYFMFIAIINEKDKNIQNTKLDKWLGNILCIIFAILIIFNLRCAYGKYLLTKKDYNNAIKYYPYCKEIKEKMIRENDKDVDFIKQYLKTEKNGLQAQMCRRIYNKTKNKYEENKGYDAKENLKFLYNELVENERVERYSVSGIINRGTLINGIIMLTEQINIEKQDEELNQMIEGYAEKFLSNYTENVMQIKALDKNFRTEKQIKNELETYEKIYNDMIMYQNKYRLQEGRE